MQKKDPQKNKKKLIGQKEQILKIEEKKKIKLKEFMEMVSLKTTKIQKLN